PLPKQFHDLVSISVENTDQGGNDFLIIAGSRSLLKVFYDILYWPGILVNAHCGKRITDFSNNEKAAVEMNFISCQASGIPLAIHTFMMLVDVSAGLPQRGDGRENLIANLHMCFHGAM